MSECNLNDCQLKDDVMAIKEAQAGTSSAVTYLKERQEAIREKQDKAHDVAIKIESELDNISNIFDESIAIFKHQTEALSYEIERFSKSIEKKIDWITGVKSFFIITGKMLAVIAALIAILLGIYKLYVVIAGGG